MPFPFQEALSFSDHLLAAGLYFLFALAGACVCGGSVFTLIAGSRASGSMDPRWDGLALLCAKTTRALAAWAACPLGLALWVVMMAQRPRMMEQLHSIFLAPALLGLLLFAAGLCCSGRYISSWGRDRHESRLHSAWGFISAIGFWGAAVVLVSICAFSVHTGAWVAEPALSNALWNPAFPAAFLTWAAVSISAFGAFGLLYAAAREDGAWRAALAHELGKWMAGGAAVGVPGWIWWGISLPESANQKPVFWLVAAAVAATAALGGIGYRWGVRAPEAHGRRHAGAASALVVLLMAAFGWAYVEAKGHFQIHRYMYRNGMIIEEAVDSNRTGLWNIVNLGEPVPAQAELGAFGFRAQCMACHADWVKPQDPARLPRFRLKGDALRFLGEMRSKHPPYPLLAGAPEERRALAAYLETLITKSGRTLASRPEPPAGNKPAAPSAMVSTTSPGDAEKRPENPEAGKPETVEKGAAVPVLPSPDAAQAPKRTQEAKAPEKEVRAIGSPASPAAAPGAGKPGEAAGFSTVSSSPPGDGQDAEGAPEAGTPLGEKSGIAAPPAPLSAAPGAGSPADGKSVSAASSAPPDDSQDAKKAEEKNSP